MKIGAEIHAGAGGHSATSKPDITALLDLAEDGLMALDADFHVTHLNIGAQHLLGGQKETVLGGTFWEEYPEALNSPAMPHLQRVMLERIPAQFEVNWAATGKAIDFCVQPWEAGGIVIRLRASATGGVCEQPTVQDPLEESRERLSLATDAAKLGIVEWDVVSDRALFENERMYEIFGHSPMDRMLTKAQFIRDVIHPDDLEDFERSLQAGMKPGALLSGVCRICRKDNGELRWIEYSGRCKFGSDGTPTRLIGVVADITDRRPADETVQRTNQLLEAVLNHTHMLVACLDYNFNFILVNRAYATADDKNPDFYPGKNHFELFPNAENEIIFRDVVRTGRPCFLRAKPFEYPNNPERGVTYWDWSLIPVLDAKGQVQLLILTLDDVTPLKRAEESIRLSEQRFRVALQNTPISVHTTDLELRYTWIHNSLFGIAADEMLGKKDEELLPIEGIADLISLKRRVLETGRAERRQITATVREQEFVLDTTAEPLRNAVGQVIGLTVATMDVTEMKHAEQALREAQKRESIGLLAGGVAHDFNNLLTGIQGNASLALQDLSAEHPARVWVQQVIKTSEKAADLTRQLLAYAGKGRLVAGRVNLSSVVVEMVRLLRASIPATTQIEVDVPEDLPAVEADVGQMHQVVTNLVLNASEAMQNKPGQVLIRTTVETLDSAEVTRLGSDVPPGRYVCLEVRDTGCGMDSVVQSKIFDPFFSTKFAGRGLGLAAVMGIVRSHNGAIQVDSVPGNGSMFRVLLPASESTAPSWAEASGKVPDWFGEGTVLVVDDQETVREVARSALERHGYSVLVASDGPQALEIFGQVGNRISLVLLDLTMPAMSGEETLRRLQEIRHDIPVLLSSGYDESEADVRFSGKGVAGFLSKPYTALQLVHKVRRLFANTAA